MLLARSILTDTAYGPDLSGRTVRFGNLAVLTGRVPPRLPAWLS